MPASGGMASAAWSSRRNEGGPERRYDDGPRSDYGGRPEYGQRDRPERREVPFPTQAPYVLYLTGLPYEGTEQDVLDLLPDFLGGELNDQVKGVKVPIKDGKLRHAFIEFDSAEGLRTALGLSGQEFMGRKVACLVADAPANGRRDRDDDRTRWGPASGSGFASSFARRDNYNNNSGERSYQRPPRFGERDSAPAERKPLNLAPRSVESSSSGSASGAPKLDPFGGATASTRDIYAEKPRPAPSAAPAASSGPRAPPKPREEQPTTEREWKTKDKEFKPSFRSFGDRESTAGSAGRGDRGNFGSGSARGAPRGGQKEKPVEGEWRSAGGKPQQQQQQQQQRTKAAPLSNNSQGEASNPFDLLGNE